MLSKRGTLNVVRLEREADADHRVGMAWWDAGIRRSMEGLDSMVREEFPSWLRIAEARRPEDFKTAVFFAVDTVESSCEGRCSCHAGLALREYVLWSVLCSRFGTVMSNWLERNRASSLERIYRASRWRKEAIRRRLLPAARAAARRWSELAPTKGIAVA